MSQDLTFSDIQKALEGKDLNGKLSYLNSCIKDGGDRSLNLYQAKGMVLTQQKDYSSAMECFDKILELSNTDPIKPDFGLVQTYFNKALCCLSLDNLDDAIESFNKAILHIDQAYDNQKAKAFYGNIYKSKGDALLKQEKYQDALQPYKLYLEYDPEDIDILHEIAFIYAQLEQYDDVINTCDKALEIKPDDALFYCNKGDALRKQEKYKEAITCLDKNLELDPGNPFALCSKGLCYLKLGRDPKASQCFSLVQEIVSNKSYDLTCDEVALLQYISSPQYDPPLLGDKGVSAESE